MPAGRKPKTIDRERVRAMSSRMCTTEEIAADQKCSKDTIERRFMRVMKEGREVCKASIRSRQYEVAMGTPGRPAEYLRDGQGNPVLKDGVPFLVRSEVKPAPPNVSMLIWLGKQYLGQSDKFLVGDDDGGGFAFAKSK